MLQSNPRGTLALYFILAATLTALIVTGAVAPPIGAGLLVAYMAFIWLTARPQHTRRLPETLPQVKSRMVRPRPTSQAQEATALARPSVFTNDFMLQDIGLIVDERSRSGLSLRRARLTSLDDESIRPYVVLHHTSYPRQVLLRFEIGDASGHTQFIYEMEHMLRPGENLIVPDYRLRLRGNEKLSRIGTWDLTVGVDGHTIGIHNFTMSPSISERLRVMDDGEAALPYDEEDLPLSLEELLRQSR